MREREEDKDGFIEDHLSRKQTGAAKRKAIKSNKFDHEKRIHPVVKSKERWHFDPSKHPTEDEDLNSEF